MVMGSNPIPITIWKTQISRQIMGQEDVLLKVTERANSWLKDGYDADTQAEVRRMLAATDKTELIEAFYKNLEFGTGGLRGIMGAGTNRMNRYTVSMATQGLSNYLLKAFPGEEIKVVIGHDCRHNSRYFAETAANVFSANGIKVFLFDALRPTPEISFAIRYLGCKSGVMVTASHNPKEYNGYKAYWCDGAQMIAPHDENTIAEVSRIASIEEVKQEANPTLIKEIGADIDRAFIEAVKGLSLAQDAIKRHHDMPIVYTPIHGTGQRIVPRALREFGFSNIIGVPEQDHISGDFPTVVSPNPEEPAALALAIERANETGADLVLGSDPDGDRLGVAVRDKEGNMTLINGNQICMLLTYYSIARRKEIGELRADDYVVKTIVTTELIRAIADDYKVTLHDTYTGFKWIADVIRKNEGKHRYIGGGEESYGFLWEDFIRDKSSVSACCMFSELTVWAKDKGLTILELLDEIYLKYGYYADKGMNMVRKGREGASEIKEMMRSFRENPPKELVGQRIVEIRDYDKLQCLDLRTGATKPLDMPTTSNVLQYYTDGGIKLSIRPSGTEPKIKFYICVKEPVSSRADLPEARKNADLKIAQIRKWLGFE